MSSPSFPRGSLSSLSRPSLADSARGAPIHSAAFRRAVGHMIDRVSRAVAMAGMSRGAWIGQVATGLALVAVGSGAAQDRPSPAPRAGWTARRVGIIGDITPADRARAIATLDAIERVFMRVPELANPDGFVISPLFAGATRQLGLRDAVDRRNVFEYKLELGLCDPTVQRYGCGSITVAVNSREPPGSGGALRDPDGRAVYIEAVRGDAYGMQVTGPFGRDAVPGATETYYRLSPVERSWVTVLLAAGGDLPWRPVTREEYYNTMIFDVEGKDGEKLRGLPSGKRDIGLSAVAGRSGPTQG